MKLTGENRSSRGKTCPSATLSTTNPTWTDPGSNPGLRGERPATNRLSHGTAMSHLLMGKTHTDVWGEKAKRLTRTCVAPSAYSIYSPKIILKWDFWLIMLYFSAYKLWHTVCYTDIRNSSKVLVDFKIGDCVLRPFLEEFIIKKTIKKEVSSSDHFINKC